MEIDINAGATFEIPSNDYQLNVCLGNISKEITENELTHMKFLLSGDGGTPKGVLEKITTPLKLFEHLKGRCLLSRENILYLQAMFYHAGRIDLFNKMLDFAKQRGETLHCFSESETPVSGYQFVRVHVAGTDNYNRSTLEAIQAAVVQGIQATQSYLITFMVPDHCIKFLTMMKSAEKRCLLSLGVDTLIIEGTTIALKERKDGKDMEEPVQELQLNKELHNCFIRNASLKKQLEHYQLSEMNSRLNVPSDLSKSLTLLITLLFNIVKNKTTQLISTISITSAHNFFQHCLAKVKGLGYDMHVIYSLLEAQSIIVRKENLEGHRLFIQQQQHQIEGLESCIGVLKAERAKIKNCIGQSFYKQLIFENKRSLFVYCIDESLPSFLVHIGVGYTLEMDQLNPYLKEASTFLTKTDTERLIQGFEINQDEEKVIRGGKPCFIEALIKADVHKRGDFNIDLFGQKLVSIVNRKEFETKWQSQMDKYFLKYKRKMDSDIPIPKEKSKTGLKTRNRQTFDSNESDDKINRVADDVDHLKKQMSQLENMMHNPLARLAISRSCNSDSFEKESNKAQQMDED